VKNFKVRISPDKLSAFLTVIAGPADYPSEEDIYEDLHINNIVFGILADQIKKIVEDKKPVSSVLIACGTIPKGALDWAISIENPRKPTITKGNRADFKTLVSYQYVNKDDVLVTLLDSSQSTPGKTITGLDIAPAEDELYLPEYKNIRSSDDKKSLIADQSGYIHWENNVLIIDDVFHVKGDVDYGTGNLKLKGSVIIDGDVRSGFRVETDGSIFIGGTVDAAHLYAQNGDITITNGILGQDRAKVLCGGSLTCGFMQDASVAVKKDVTIERYAINCIISSGGIVKTTNPDSVIRGGIVTAEKGIITNEAGSERSVYTELKIRNYSEGESQTQLWKLGRDRSNLTMKLSSMLKRKEFLMVLIRRVKSLSDEKKSELKTIDDEIEILKNKLQKLSSEEILLQKETSKEIVQKELQIHGVMHRNVRVDIGGQEYFCDSEIENVRIFKLDKEIVLESLKDPANPEYNIFVPEQK
jgi:uncharacterized protein